MSVFVRQVAITEGLLRSNPVWAVERILESLPYEANWSAAAGRLSAIIQWLELHEIHLHQAAVDDLCRRGLLLDCRQTNRSSSSCRWGVVGLTVDQASGNAFVVPLRAELAEEWHCAATLPFSPHHLQDLLSRLIHSGGAFAAAAVPERFAFRLQDTLGMKIVGRSMDIAGILAIIDELNARTHHLLWAACCVVELAEGDHLRRVDDVQLKLSAFHREHPNGSLLIRHADCDESALFDSHFQQVWPVRTLTQLGGRLLSNRLLDPLLHRTELTRRELSHALDRLRWLEYGQFRYREAYDLASRIVRCAVTADVKPAEHQQVACTMGSLSRHLGQFSEAKQIATERMSQLDHHPQLTCDDELARAAVRYAAALFDGHEFRAAESVLRPWFEHAVRVPRTLYAATRVHLFNTMGRVLAILGDPSYVETFHRALELQQQGDPANVARTSNYLVLAELRNGRVEVARGMLERSDLYSQADLFSNWMFCFARAELARRERRRWDDVAMDEENLESLNPGHPFAFYFQATARQPDRPDRTRRFGLAATFLAKDIVGDAPCLLHFYSAVMRLAEAAYSSDENAAGNAHQTILAYAAHPRHEAFRGFYQAELLDLRQSLDICGVERLLSRLPLL